jgi:hypothetical protein
VTLVRHSALLFYNGPSSSNWYALLSLQKGMLTEFSIEITERQEAMLRKVFTEDLAPIIRAAVREPVSEAASSQQELATEQQAEVGIGLRMRLWH